MKFVIRSKLKGGVCLLLFIIQFYYISAATLENLNTGPLYDVHVVVGGRAELPCDIHTQDPTDRVILVLWFKDGEGGSIYTYESRRNSRTTARDWSDAQTLGARAHFDIKASPSALVLDNVRQSDEGHYRCRVDFKKSPTRNARTELNVIIPPNPPTVLSESGVQVWTMVGPYDEGSSLVLTCEVTGGKPPPNVTWWFGQKLLDETYEIPRAGVYTNTLQIPKLTREHLHASLVCQASNSNYSAPVQTIITVEMNFKPLSVRFLGSREPLSAGKPYELECQSVGARPPAIITWWLGNIQLTNATSRTTNSGNVTLSQLHFTPEDQHANKYLICKAQSPVIDHTPLADDWQLEIYYFPVVHLTLGSSLRPDSIREGDDVYFECHVRANPWLYKIVWYHNGVLVHHNVAAGVIISNQSLVIQSVKREHTGLYTCVASNIEGDGESNAFNLKVQYSPVCASDQIHVYGAARHEEVTVTCKLDAVPPVVSFNWRFNNSGDIVDIAESHVSTKGLQSSLSYIARTELDYGTLLCWGINELGRQRKPCIYKVVPAGPPDTPLNCTLSNSSASMLHVRCLPGYDGGLGQTFIAEAFDIKTNHLRLNISEASVPDFQLAGLESGTGFKILIYAVNSKGLSKKQRIQGYTLKDIAERRTAQVRPPPERDLPITPLLAVGVGVAGSLLLVILVAVVILRLNREKRRPRLKPVILPLHTPLTEEKEPEDSNPDVIPNSGSEPEGKPTTPEEGGFGSVHICASVPTYNGQYPSNVYSTMPRNGRQPNSPQTAELMYAELAFSRGHYTNSGSLPRRKGDPTVYAKLDHMSSSPTGSVDPLVPSSYMSPSSSVSSSSVLPSIRNNSQSPPYHTPQSYPSHINVPITLGARDPSLPLSVRSTRGQSPPTGYSLNPSALSMPEMGPVCLGVSYKPPSIHCVGYEGHIPPPALMEEDEGTSGTTPLMQGQDNKESSV